jgi:hypothetical protein
VEIVPSLEPRNLDSIRHIISAISNHSNFTVEELKVYLLSSNYEFNDSYNLLEKCKIIGVDNDCVVLRITEIDFINIYREVLLESCKYNINLRKSALQIGINRSGNYIRRENVDQLLRNSDLYQSHDNEVSYWWFQLKEIDRDNSTLVNQGDPLTGFYGERLTLEFEKHRLTDQTQIEWVSLLSNGDRFGYDMKSVREERGEKMFIEVKSSKKNFNNAKIYLTRNEYKVMLQNVQDYVFYLWWDVDEYVGKGPFSVEGAVLAEKLCSLVNNEIAFSDSLIIPFSVFKRD